MTNIIPVEYFKFRSEFNTMSYTELMAVWAEQFESGYSWKSKPIQQYKLKAMFETIKSRSTNPAVKDFINNQSKALNFGDI